ncbi:MAG: NADH-quinone oxidoreductase subunit L [Clostridia bacterium]|nr:NADH-quinone oxidoreductase subunit L [Clostridia bacterium]
MEPYLIIAAILVPSLSAALCYLIRKAAIRNFIVVLTSIAMFAVAGGLVKLLMESGGKLTVDFEHMPLDIGYIIKALDFCLFLYIAYIGFRFRKPLVIILTMFQFVLWFLFEIYGLFGTVHEPVAFVIDYLSLIMVLLISIIGPIITVFAIGYMKEHEHHLHLKISRQPRFFMILFVFLGAMNALVMTNNLSWMYFFWEVTTLCSFLLISHDGNSESVRNGLRALILNSIGGLAFIAAIVVIYTAKGTLSIEEISSAQAFASSTALLPVGLGLLCFAGFTKSAQFPFQSWLLGAMVAPTPVSALLHSSTMVKAGVYLVVRMAPAFSGTLLGKIVAVVGGFTFLAGSALAISQRNAKRVLAYSTIANLGLIICCAGIGSNVALGAAILLIVFHAVSKGLLFLCVGTIEHGIGSRDIEDMQGLMRRMPFTTVITVIGMISMLLPPFGVLVTKWLAIEAAVDSPLVLMLIVLGSAFTVVFWAKWIGIVLTMSYRAKYNIEKLPVTVKGSLAVLLLAVLGCSIGIVPFFNSFVKPQLMQFGILGNSRLGGDSLGLHLEGMNGALMGGFASILFFAIVIVLMITIPAFLRITKPESVKQPYLCGENTAEMKGLEFTSPGDKVEPVVVRNYYLSGFFGENNLTLWTNIVASAIILIMFGAVIG